MNAGAIWKAFLIANAFISWPIIGQYSRANGGWVGTIVAFGTGMTIVILALFRGQLGSAPDTKAVTVLLIAGVVNGIAVYGYSQFASDRTISIAIFAATVSIFMVMCAPVVSAMVLGTVPSLKQVAGIACGVAAVWLLK